MTSLCYRTWKDREGVTVSADQLERTRRGGRRQSQNMTVAAPQKKSTRRPKKNDSSDQLAHCPSPDSAEVAQS